MKAIYTGVFILNQLTGKLEKKIVNPHVTHEFRPKEVNKALFGQQVIFKVVGYACDGENEGYKVEVFKASDEMREALNQVKCLHITLSVSKTGKPVNTKNLDFQPCRTRYLTGTYGAFTGSQIIFW